MSDEQFIEFAREACEEFGKGDITDERWAAFGGMLSYVSTKEGPHALADAVKLAEKKLQGLGSDVRRLHYLSVPPKAAQDVIRQLEEADLVERARIIMEKPFGTDLESAKELNAKIHEVFSEEQIFRIDHFLGKEAAQNILAFRFANGLFEPIWNRNFIDHVQIDIPETLGLEGRTAFYESTGAYRDMVVTHLMQVLAFMAMEPPTSLAPDPIGEEKNKVFRSIQPLDPRNVVRGQYSGYRGKNEVADDSDTETFIAMKVIIDNWRWAGVPFFLRTGKKLAEGARIISIAFKEPPLTMFPANSGAGTQGPDHLTFDLADQSKMSLSFYGKRPGPGMKLEKLSMQFATQETSSSTGVLEAYERLIHDAMRGDHTLFTTAEGIETLWEISQPLLDNPPPVRLYAPGSWGPNSIHQLIAPHAWRLPFERSWRETKKH
jgi:glucose-6-phosphate 1-dehydrogenase